MSILKKIYLSGRWAIIGYTNTVQYPWNFLGTFKDFYTRTVFLTFMQYLYTLGIGEMGIYCGDLRSILG